MKNLKSPYFLLIVIIICGFTLQSCGPETTNPKKPTDLGFFPLGEVKDYVYFKPGTWWIYENTRTGILDSIIVNYSLLDTLEQNSERWHFTNELFDVESESLTTGHYYAFYMRSLSAEVINFKWGCTPAMERSNPYEGEFYPFYYPFDEIKDKTGDYHAYCLTVKDTMKIENVIYKGVAIFYIKWDEIEPYPLKDNAAKYYWARNYGLIQKDLFDSKFKGDTSVLYHSWKLINSNIIQ